MKIFEQRLTKLEKQLSFWKKTTLALAVAFAGTCFIGAATRDMTVIRRLKLVDDEGKLRALLGVTKINSVNLSLMSPDGKPKISMVVRASGVPSVNILGDDGKVRMTSTLTKDELPVTYYNDNNNEQRLVFTANPSAVICNNESGKARSAICVGKSGTGALSMMDKNGQTIPIISIPNIGEDLLGDHMIE